jgi:hypothetical protein
MADEVRLWRILQDENLAEVKRVSLDLESRLQEWLARDISILDPNLLVIGREVETDFGGFIDILCMDPAGDLVIAELKRDKTPREITAQALDYASWVVHLSNERVRAIADSYLGADGLEGAFRARFQADVPETLNGSHRILVVGSVNDSSSERIIRYLSDTHGVNINAATFQYFREPDGAELLGRIFLLEPSEVESRARDKGASKRLPNLTYEELDEQARERGVDELYLCAVLAFEPFLSKHTTRSSLGFAGMLEGSRKTVFSLLPGESSLEDGLCFRIYSNRFAALAGISLERLEELLPDKRKHWIYYPTAGPDGEGFEGFFSDPEEIEHLAGVLEE